MRYFQDFVKGKLNLHSNILKITEIQAYQFWRHKQLSECHECEILRSNQEEVDMKVILHTLDALSTNKHGNVVLCAPYGETNILVMALSLTEVKNLVIFLYFVGDNKKQLWLDEIFKAIICQALIGFHAFTGNYYISAFFQKSKAMRWKRVVKTKKFIDAFRSLGEWWQLSEESKIVLEEYL